MKNLTKILYLTIAAFFTFSCANNDDDDDVTEPQNREEVTVSGNITANTTWEENKKYLLSGFVYVKSGATLTIQPGTIIKGDKATKGTLIVEPGAKIIADGTAQKPIVFTSAQAKGSRNSGDWGGIIVLGKATTNKATPTIEGENTTTYGGSDDADNSGILRYVRIEFAGIAFETDKEINGLTLGAVGSGTTIDYVQVSHSGDDAFEWFGGTVNPKHLISYKTLDDDFDTDYGFRGNVQYGLILRDPSIADQCTCSDSNGFESDNDGDGSTATPKTAAKFANISMYLAPGTVNAKYRSAFRVRKNSAISIYNTVVVGAYPKAGLELEGSASQANFTSGVSDYRGLVLTGMATPTLNVDQTLFTDASRANATATAEAELKLNANYNILTGMPGTLPQAGSPLLTGGVTLPAGFEANSYRGAFNTTDWTQGWANFDPQNTDY
jgi:hypothetical protein